MITESLAESVAYIRTLTKLKPRVGVILGSGLGSFIDQIEVEADIPYADIPHFLPTSVEGHVGRLILGKIGGVPIAALQGRIHYYEGHSMATVVYPTRTLAMLGIETLVITNSAGGLEPKMHPGDFMIIEDHINLMGDNPLKGPNISQLGPRFPDMTEAYDRKLSEQMAEILKEHGVVHWRGIYCGVSGPCYETPAEVRHLQSLGGKAVGMSTVPESIAGNHLGLRVCGISCITNNAAGISAHKLSHQEVTDTAKLVSNKFGNFLKTFVSAL